MVFIRKKIDEEEERQRLKEEVNRAAEEEREEMENERREIKREVIKSSKKEKYELVEIPTQTSVVIREVGTDNLLDDKAILLTILNKLSIIEKAII